jgi:hypothetical protein
MFLLYHSEGCNTSETVFHWCYVNDLHTKYAVVCRVTATVWRDSPVPTLPAPICLWVVCHPESHCLPPMLHHVFATFHRRAARDSIDGERGGYAEDEGDGRGQERHHHREVRRVGRKRMWGLGRGGRFCSLIYVFTAYDKKSYVHKQDGSLCLLVPLVSGPIQHRPNRRSGRWQKINRIGWLWLKVGSIFTMRVHPTNGSTVALADSVNGRVG